MTLFELDPLPDPLPEPKKIGPDARRTIRNRAAIAAGRHPLNEPLLNDPLIGAVTCGDCANLVRHTGSSHTWWKCRFHVTFGPATDVRKSWPACVRYEPSKEQK